jgi:dihydropteroate synthase
MIDLAGLAGLAAAHPDALRTPVAPIRWQGTTVDTDEHPLVMGIVNLSGDSSYRSSIAPSPQAAIRRGRVLVAQGADVVDIGAESTQGSAARVGTAEQIAQLVPVIEQLSAAGVPVSVESYDVAVVRAALAAGARVVNLTGSTSDDEVFTAAAEFDATVVVCHLYGASARDLGDHDLPSDPIPVMLDGFAPRLARARELGARSLIVDPGVGFWFARAATPPAARLGYQTGVLLNSFRLRELGVPVCQSVPHGFSLFEEEFRTGEAFFTTLARIAGAGMIRTHEVALVVPVLRALAALTP